MEKESTNNCCKGCQNGKKGNNPTCQAKLMIDKLKVAQGSQKKIINNNNGNFEGFMREG